VIESSLVELIGFWPDTRIWTYHPTISKATQKNEFEFLSSLSVHAWCEHFTHTHTYVRIIFCWISIYHQTLYNILYYTSTSFLLTLMNTYFLYYDIYEYQIRCWCFSKNPCFFHFVLNRSTILNIFNDRVSGHISSAFTTSQMRK
jgi:hypothetical protein